MKLGAAVYALVAVGSIVSAVFALRGYGRYAGAEQWYLVAISTLFALTGVLFGVGAVTRRGLISDDGPRICRDGWIVVVALVGAEFVVTLLSDGSGAAPFPNPVVVFVPHWVRRMQESYYEGVAEARRELNREEPDEASRPAV